MNACSRVAIALVGMTGLVVAQPKTDPKPGGDMKAADAKAGGMPEMNPPAELADMAKMAGGTWTCKGQAVDHTMKMVDMTATMKIKLDVVNWWIHSSFESKAGKEPFQFESFTTFDPASKKWKRVMVESDGGWSSGDSAGSQDKKEGWGLPPH